MTECAAAIVAAEVFALVVQPEQAAAVLVAAGEQGPAGSPGPAGGSTIQRAAGEIISALRVVYEQGGAVFVLGNQDATHIDQILGLSLTAAGTGQPVNVQRSGVVDDGSWSWALGRVWLGSAGALTQNPPADGFDVLIGTAVSATRITLNIQEPIDITE